MITLSLASSKELLIISSDRKGEREGHSRKFNCLSKDDNFGFILFKKYCRCKRLKPRVSRAFALWELCLQRSAGIFNLTKRIGGLEKQVVYIGA